MREPKCSVIELVPGCLYALGASLELHGHTSWAAAAASGLQRSSCYLLLGDHQAVLIDTGPAVVRPCVMNQLRALLPQHPKLSVFLTRAEFETSGNLGAIAATFPLDAVYTGGAANPFDGFELAMSAQGRHLDQIPAHRIAAGDFIPIGPGRNLQVLTPSLRMLSAYWAYDTGSKALFPSDAFGYTVDSADVTADEAWRNLAARYWWLPGAQTEQMVDSLRNVFESREIEIIAPVHGCIFTGRTAVTRHYRLMRQLLTDAAWRT